MRIASAVPAGAAMGTDGLGDDARVQPQGYASLRQEPAAGGYFSNILFTAEAIFLALFRGLSFTVSEAMPRHTRAFSLAPQMSTTSVPVEWVRTFDRLLESLGRELALDG